jgi:lactate dehydrogenase-like 2-hydroxyacid dehydrogenase
MIDAARLARMSPGTILINTARIGLLDEASVVAAISSGHLGGVGLDAKLDLDSPLRRLSNDPRLLVTPHIGWYSARSAEELRKRTVLAAIASAEAMPASDKKSHGEKK